jgi:hypothetical protein
MNVLVHHPLFSFKDSNFTTEKDDVMAVLLSGEPVRRKQVRQRNRGISGITRFIRVKLFPEKVIYL